MDHLNHYFFRPRLVASCLITDFLLQGQIRLKNDDTCGFRHGTLLLHDKISINTALTSATPTTPSQQINGWPLPSSCTWFSNHSTLVNHRVGALGLLEAFRDETPTGQHSRPTFAFILNGYVTRLSTCICFSWVDHSPTDREFGTNFRPSRLGVPQESCRNVWWCNQIAKFFWGELR